MTLDNEVHENHLQGARKKRRVTFERRDGGSQGTSTTQHKNTHQYSTNYKRRRVETGSKGPEGNSLLFSPRVYGKFVITISVSRTV